jgi:hypothetical protein
MRDPESAVIVSNDAVFTLKCDRCPRDDRIDPHEICRQSRTKIYTARIAINMNNSDLAFSIVFSLSMRL